MFALRGARDAGDDIDIAINLPQCLRCPAPTRDAPTGNVNIANGVAVPGATADALPTTPTPRQYPQMFGYDQRICCASSGPRTRARTRAAEPSGSSRTPASGS